MYSIGRKIEHFKQMLKDGSKRGLQMASEQFAKHPSLLRAKDAVCDKALNFTSHAMDFERNPGEFLRGNGASADMKGLIVSFFGLLILIKIMAPTVPQAYHDLNASTDVGGTMADASPADKSNIQSGASLVSMVPFIFIGLVILRQLGH